MEDCIIYKQVLELSNDKMERELDWKKICTTINCLPLEHAEAIYILILNHYLSELRGNNVEAYEQMIKIKGMDGKKLQQIYGIKTSNNGKGIMMNVNNIPNKLQQIIATYIEQIIE